MHGLTFHGGRIDAAARQYPEAPRPWLDLSTGINPLAWQPDVPLTVDLRRLPSPDALAALEAAAAARFGLVAGAIAAVPGSEVALRLLGTLGLPRPYRVVGPAYRTHFAALPGARVIGAGEVSAGSGTLLLANPNNPDGRLSPPAELLEMARGGDGILVIDEAFADACASVLPLLREDDPVLVLRSFGKFYGLAGVRLGFVCGARRWVAEVAELLGSWPVSATALAWGTAAYSDATWSNTMCATLAERCAALDATLVKRGWRPVGACPLFRMVETDDAPAVFERLARAGVLVRPFEDDARRLRFGVPGDDAALARLAAALDG